MWRVHKKCYITSQGKRWKFHKKLTLRRPGIEPRSTAWKAAMLTVTPSTLFVGQPSSILFTWITANTKEARKSLLLGVGFEPTPTNVDQKTRQSLKSGAFDRSANLTSTHCFRIDASKNEFLMNANVLLRAVQV